MKLLISERKFSKVIENFLEKNLEIDGLCTIKVTEYNNDIWLTLFFQLTDLFRKGMINFK